MENHFIENAKVMSKGQVTIPKAVREVIGISTGDRVSFLVREGKVEIINSKDYLSIYEKKMRENGDEDEMTGVKK